VTDSEYGYQGWSSLPPDDPTGWINGVPTSGHDQSCAICGALDVVWVHPLDPERVRYREYGKGHRLPTFWCLCDPCEQLHRAGYDQNLVELMKAAPGWYWESPADIDECLRQPLAAFRRADRGARPLATG
jgi:hypothetical protein